MEEALRFNSGTGIEDLRFEAGELVIEDLPGIVGSLSRSFDEGLRVDREDLWRSFFGVSRS